MELLSPEKCTPSRTFLVTSDGTLRKCTDESSTNVKNVVTEYIKIVIPANNSKKIAQQLKTPLRHEKHPSAQSVNIRDFLGTTSFKKSPGTHSAHMDVRRWA